jgi:hypothetical protein
LFLFTTSFSCCSNSRSSFFYFWLFFTLPLFVVMFFHRFISHLLFISPQCSLLFFLPSSFPSLAYSSSSTCIIHCLFFPRSSSFFFLRHSVKYSYYELCQSLLLLTCDDWRWFWYLLAFRTSLPPPPIYPSLCMCARLRACVSTGKFFYFLRANKMRSYMQMQSNITLHHGQRINA